MPASPHPLLIPAKVVPGARDVCIQAVISEHPFVFGPWHTLWAKYRWMQQRLHAWLLYYHGNLFCGFWLGVRTTCSSPLASWMFVFCWRELSNFQNTKLYSVLVCKLFISSSDINITLSALPIFKKILCTVYIKNTSMFRILKKLTIQHCSNSKKLKSLAFYRLKLHRIINSWVGETS